MQHLVQTALRLRLQGLDKSKALKRGRLVLCFTLVKTPDTLADNDLKLMLLVNPVAHIAPVNTHFKGRPGRTTWLPYTGVPGPPARSAGPTTAETTRSCVVCSQNARAADCRT